MAARVLLRKRALAPLATLALGGIAFAPATVLAEAPADLKQRKPIYDDVDVTSPNAALPPAPKPIVEAPVEEHKPRGPTPTDRLAGQIGKARLFLHKYAALAEDKVNDTVDSAFHLEQSFTNTIASLAPPRESGEKLMPGAIYVLVAAMAGSIITRNRNILLRATVPLAVGIGAGWVVLPITMQNTADLAWKYEQRFPVIAESHVRLREGIQNSLRFAKVHGDLGVRMVDEKVTSVREGLEDWVSQGK
ncbi:MICOS subunit MIC26 [Paramyrothecium foliicola]|nr:MICOS subunit MIC26 [Paramyrothecium foliicola]